MKRWRFLLDPLEGRTSIGKVIWLYGVLGSLAYSVIGMPLEPGGPAWHLYTIGGLLFSLYVTVATYQCARNCKTAFGRWLVRIGAVLTLLLLPVLTYLDWNGALELTSLRGLQ